MEESELFLSWFLSPCPAECCVGSSFFQLERSFVFLFFLRLEHFYFFFLEWV